MSTLQANVVTPDGQVFDAQVNMVSVRTIDGELGILPNHIPLVTPLAIGAARLKQDGEVKMIALSGGFMEVRSDEVNILAESAELPTDIDITRARAAKERAERRMQEAKQENVDFRRAELALKRALNRLEVAKR
ncbi:F0F1 ATP synthase subunit epsilon [Alkalicoccus chagannorensis]|uniref:F0F1 ATP synthase subunit epsilon n=1 Tax=Alkalicoccus chagannorensis TaxID=427072 RepID=UPI000415757B|nr:F0F1 ATP synthase subunit epsilon [Alkalicoccus chagannorensis]